MGYSHLLAPRTALANFREAYGVPEDINIAYCHEGDIALNKGSGPNVAFFPIMAILEGGVRFPVDSLVVRTLRFYGLCPDQLPPNFYRVVSCVSRLNQIFSFQLNHHDINFMYSLCSNIKSDYYLKTRNMRVRLISCMPDLNRNSAGEFIWVSGNWLADKPPCPLSPRNVSRYRASILLNYYLSLLK